MMVQLEHVAFAYHSKAFASQEVFLDLNLQIDAGECVALVGEEGRGKTTLLQLLAALWRPAGGTVMVDGADVWSSKDLLKRFRHSVGFAFQFPEQQFFAETVEEEILFASRNLRKNVATAATRLRSLLQEIGIEESVLNRSPFSLSLGEARRVALASILLHEPEVVLLDEPTAGLDGLGFDFVLTLLRRLPSEGKALVFASHDYELVSAVASRIILLQEGNQLHEFSPQEFSAFSELH